MLLAKLVLWVSLFCNGVQLDHVNSFPGLTRALAAEVGKSNIRVNVIIPGYIETDMTTGMFYKLSSYKSVSSSVACYQ